VIFKAMSATIGSYFIEVDQPEVSAEEQVAVAQFHDLYYRRWLHQGGDTINLSWFGYRIAKCPLDLWIYQELLVRTRPDFVVETGTYYGGSALYFAMLLDQIGHGRVITIDIEEQANRPEHPRITYLSGSSTDRRVVAQVHRSVAEKRAMVVLDSDHKAPHVYEEIVAFSPLVQPGHYLVVEDTDVNGHPTWPEFGPGPMEAVDKFLEGNDAFVRDDRCERFLMTLNPRGYLYRTNPAGDEIGQ
jgi:cephalosporin hydroxylase